MNTSQNNRIGTDFGLLLNQWKVLDHTVFDFKVAFDKFYLKEILKEEFVFDGIVKDLYSRIINLHNFKFSFILETGEIFDFDFTHAKHIGNYIDALEWFFKMEYSGKIDIEFLN